jgi:hypothetical protein
VIDPVDKALALLVDEMGFSVAASKKALAASDNGSELNTAKAIALLQEGVTASSSEKIPVVPANDTPKPALRFGGMKFKFGKPAPPVASPTPSVKSIPPPAPPKKSFGELRPTKKERTEYAELSKEEAKGLKQDVFRAQVYKDTFDNLFHGGREEKPKKGKSKISAVEVSGRPLSSPGSWSVKSLDAASTSTKQRETITTAADARSLRS